MTRATSLCFLISLLLVGLLALPAQAQQARTLDIRDGQVVIDGRPVPADSLPPALDVDGLEAHYHFVGIDRPVVELNGTLYAMSDRLEPVSEQEVRGQSVILRGAAQAVRPAEITSSDARSSEATASDAATDMHAARQAYLRDMERQSRELYRQLMRERAMEAEAQERARVIRLLPEGPERKAQIDSLRNALNQIFDLKQVNRRREIERLQQQILDIQRRIRKREDMRDAMIEHRMQHLVPSLAPGGSQ